jgi:hypothetical protein
MEQGDVATSDTGSYVNSPLCAGYPQHAQQIAAHDRRGPRGRTSDQITLDEIEESAF